MTDATIRQPQGYGKIGASIVSSWLASYIMTQLSLNGDNFAVLGVSSEIVKSTLIGILVGFFAWATPLHFVEGVTDIILFSRSAIKQWRDALTDTTKGD